ncbi:HlyD family efflux transporter periplasmic adaptor subunit [Adhaeretor mobilis]|uniref:Macrolide export protein MacA n=1 Tax=Adhaeretor mobilis TaxID=1930276 RepID=A0A517MZL1_9BACT|nr:HlyD family efflux transporter periplasmic adaptor subunit [Adhaeretor mobilis]QDT00320.1 Macrolide export protein MacA [Adhaeretor mobilis]
MARWLTFLLCFTISNVFLANSASLSFAKEEVRESKEKTVEASDDNSDAKAEKDSKKKTGDGSEAKAEESDKDSADKAADDSKEEDEDGETEKEEDEKSNKKERETRKVETKDLKIEITLDGIFVAEEMEEVPLRPETWSSFKVVEAVEHGARVRKGDVLVEFDDTKFEQKLAEAALSQRLDELAMMEAEEEFPRLEKSMELSFAQAKRSYEQQKFEYDRFKETMRPFTERSVRNNLKSSQQYLDNAREELEQLEKMYDADEITEETEEIVLRRQRHQVEMAEFYMEYSKLNHDYTLDVSIPRREESLTSELEFADLAFEQAKMLKSTSLSKKRYEMEQKREERARSIEEHAKLVSDRSLLKLKAPADGIVYYGPCVNGRWTSVNSMKTKLVEFGTVSANSVVMTVVKPRPMYVQTSIGEKDFPKIEKGLKTTISPVADSDLEFEGEIEEIATAPAGSNKFAVEMEVDLEDAPEWLMPGMTCKAKLTTYEAKDAVVIPQDYVNTDDDNSKLKYVLVCEDEDEEPVRRKVILGKKKDKEVEILKGLEEGDEIVKKADEKKND